MTIAESEQLCNYIEDKVNQVGDDIAQRATVAEIETDLTDMQRAVIEAPKSVISDDNAHRVAEKVQNLMDSNFNVPEYEDLQDLIMSVSDQILNND